MSSDKPAFEDPPAADGPMDSPDRRRRAQRRLRLVAWAFFGGLLGLVSALTIAWWRTERLPLLTAEAFEAAQDRWSSAAPPSYRIAVQVRGAQPGDYLVEVRNREVVSASRNGIPLKQPRTWETWSVPGMFDTLASDLEHLAEGDLAIDVRCRFDPSYGYAARYQRSSLGTAHQVSWQVTSFERTD